MHGTRRHRERPLVLVVDDDNFIRVTICDALQEAEFDTVTAGNGREGLSAIAEHRPDVVLLDLLMPEMDGFTTCSAIRNLPGFEFLPVAMMTSMEDPDSINLAFQAGASDFIIKPVNAVVLIYRLRNLLRSSQAFSAIRENQQKLREAQQIAKLGNWEWNLIEDQFQLLGECPRVLGLAEEQLDGRPETFLQSLHDDDQSLARELFDEARTSGTCFRIDLRTGSRQERVGHLHLQGQTVIGSNGTPLRLYGTLQDITELKQAEDRIRFLAHYDALTRLPNRLLFNERLSYMLAHAQRHKGQVALLFLDLDRFKLINDSLGHSSGDRLLQLVAERLTSTLRLTDLVARQSGEETSRTLARLGGDEFSLWLSDTEQISDVISVTQRLQDAFSQPFILRDKEIFVSVSIGIALYPGDGSDVETLLKNADSAMYHAKHLGGGNYQFYSESMNAAALKRLEMEKNLHRALENNELQLYYQPQLELASGRIVGAEALLRWQHLDEAPVSPGDFVPMAEETGLIVPIGEWALRSVCHQQLAWQRDGLNPCPVSVNLSSRQFWRQDMASMVSRVLDESGLEPGLLELELTESILMQEDAATISSLQRLDRMGIGLLVDDFGTGYSSLSYLHTFPISGLKIDRSFIQNLEQDDKSGTIVAAIIAMAEGLGLKVVAEGIETAGQQEFLARHNCTLIQGYLVDRPLPAEEFARMLRSS